MAGSLRNKTALRRNLAAQQVAWCKLALRNRPRGRNSGGGRLRLKKHWAKRCGLVPSYNGHSK